MPVAEVGPRRYTVAGSLTVEGVTKSSRLDFGVPYGAGGLVVSDQVGIELDLQLRAPAP